MEVLYLLIPLAVLIAIGIVAVFLWAVKSGQFDDLEGPAHRILMDDEDDRPGEREPGNKDNADKP
ncbi:MAG: cbb3-type cytochrome oxidase assembly protein CcoS [Pseudomonadota bacterium]